MASSRAEFFRHHVARGIGSGNNWSRPGLRTVLRNCFEGSLRELVVAHRDRLSRLGFSLLEFLVAEAGKQLVVHGSGGVSENDELSERICSASFKYFCADNTVFENTERNEKPPEKQQKNPRKLRQKALSFGGERFGLSRQRSKI